MPFLFGIGAKSDNGRAVGITRIADVDFETTGVLGVSYDGDGQAQRRAFPPWLTLPSNASLRSRATGIFCWPGCSSSMVRSISFRPLQRPCPA